MASIRTGLILNSLKRIDYFKRLNSCIPPSLKLPKDDNFNVNLAKYGSYIAKCLPNCVQTVKLLQSTNELEIMVAPETIVQVLGFLRDHIFAQYIGLMDITAIDVPKREFRFEIIYILLSYHYNSRLIVKTYTDEMTPIDSVTPLFYSAQWPEREVFDLFGVYFKGHPDLRRLLTDYGFDGHPLRKDFPLSGYYELRYDIAARRVTYEPVTLTQEFRKYDVFNPWEKISAPSIPETTDTSK